MNDRLVFAPLGGWSQPTTLYCAPGAANGDPVRFILEDLTPGKGRLIVCCFDRAWTCYWDAMGTDKNLKQFICEASKGYIANCLVRGNRGAITREETQFHEDAYVGRIVDDIVSFLRAQETEERRFHPPVPTGARELA